MANNNVVVGGEVQGDITSCKIENQQLAIQKNSAFSIQQTTQYITYDVCNKKTIADYRVPEITDFGIGFMVVASVALLFAMLAVALRWVDY